MKSYILGRFLEVDEDGAWMIEGPYDVASQDVGRLFDFTTPPETMKLII